MGKVFSREIAEKVANLLKECYVGSNSNGTYTIRPRTKKSFDEFDTIVEMLKNCGDTVVATQLNPASPKMATLVRSKEFAYRELLPGETIVDLVSNFYITSVVSKDLLEKGWTHKIVLTRVDSPRDFERFDQLKKELEAYGYVTLLRHNYMLVKSISSCRKFDEETYKQILCRIAA